MSLDTLSRIATTLGVPLAEVVSSELRPLFRTGATGPAGSPPGPAEGGALRPAQLPPQVPNFFGREAELRLLDERLGAAGAVELTAVRGMGGVGKTSLAVEAGYAARTRFPDGQLFIDLQGMAEHPLAPARAMARVIHSFHPERRVSDQVEEALPTYRSVLSAAGRVLLVLDNAAAAPQVRDLLVGPPAGVLVTSRRALALDGVASVPLDTLSPAEAVQMLGAILGEAADAGQLARLAEACGRLPLAIRVAGDFLRIREDWGVDRFIAELGRRPLDRLRFDDDPGRDVECVLRLSAAHLAREFPPLAERWHLLHLTGGAFDAADAAALWKGDPSAPDPDPDDVRADLSELVARSMVLYDRAVDRYDLHDLMRPVAAAFEPGAPG